MQIRHIQRAGVAFAALLLFVADGSGQTASVGQTKPSPAAPPASPLSGQDTRDDLSDQVGKLMVKCVNLLTAQDPLSLDTCKQQRDLADQYPPHERMVDRMMAHDEYGIALAAFDHKQEALAEFDREVALAPRAVKPGSVVGSTAYWHRAMIYSQMGDAVRADRDYRAAEAILLRSPIDDSGQSTRKKLRTILRQHASMLDRAGKTEAAHRLMAEAAK